jgi:type II secretory pathway pseudopilin PulG
MLCFSNRGVKVLTMKDESGYILLLVMVIICVIAFITVQVVNQTTSASFLASRRARNVRAFSLAQSAVMEGYWRLSQDPSCRETQERYWENEWYQYTIVDPSPGSTDDLVLDLIGLGHTDNHSRGVRLRLIRTDSSANYQIESWHEAN